MAEKKLKQPLSKGVAKVPMVMQLEALECGAACLTMILAYYDKWIPLEQIRVDCGVSRDGSNARNHPFFDYTLHGPVYVKQKTVKGRLRDASTAFNEMIFKLWGRLSGVVLR